MFNWIRKLFGTSTPAPAPAPAPAPKPAPAKPKAKATTKVNLSTKTKKELEDYGKANFGVDIDMRKKKSDLIKQLQNLEHNK